MTINVPKWARDHFWVEPPADSEEFWGFRFRPTCIPGDEITFQFDKKPVASAIVDRIEKPGQSQCDSTGRFGTLWKVFWKQETFKDLRAGDRK